jgi:DNA repair protein RadC
VGEWPPDSFPAYHARQGSATAARFAAAPRPARTQRSGLCLGVLHGWEIVRTTTSRQVAGPRTLRDFITIMIVHEATVNLQLVHYGEEEPLTSTKKILAYATDGVAESSEEEFWVVFMNPKRRPICRLRLKTGPLIASQIMPREVIHAVLQLEARAFACLRTVVDGPVRPNLADGRLLYILRECAAHLNLELVDYLVARLDASDYHSWHDSDQHVA